MNGVYITFRQTTVASYVSLGIQKFLKTKAITCKTGFDRLRSGEFPEELKQRINECADVIVIITPDTWGRSDDETCWMTQEIELAFSLNKNIIPVVIGDDTWYAKVPKKIQALKMHQAFVCHADYIELEMDKLVRALITKPEVVHPCQIEPYKGEKDYIFVSYCHKDSECVLPVIAVMTNKGYRVWYDEGIDPGTEWDKNIADHIIKCGFFIAFMSNNYLKSSNCRDELNFARDLDKGRFLVYTEKVELPPEMQMRLSRIQNIHKYAYENDQRFFEKLFGVENLNGFIE